MTEALPSLILDGSDLSTKGKVTHRRALVDLRSKRHQLENWLAEQEEIPSRKQVQKQWSEVPQKVIRAALASEKSRRADVSRST